MQLVFMLNASILLNILEQEAFQNYYSSSKIQIIEFTLQHVAYRKNCGIVTATKTQLCLRSSGCVCCAGLS